MDGMKVPDICFAPEIEIAFGSEVALKSIY